MEHDKGFWCCSKCTFSNNLLLSNCEICESPKDDAWVLSSDQDSFAESFSGHCSKGLDPSDLFFLSHYVAIMLNVTAALALVTDLTDRIAKHSLNVSDIDYHRCARVAMFFKRVLDYIHEDGGTQPPKLLYDSSVDEFLHSEEPRFLACAVIEEHTRLWPVVAALCFPSLARREWQVAGALERLRRGETSVIALLQGVSAASARIIAEVIFLTQSPDLLSEPPPLTAPFMQHYAGAVVMDSDVAGLTVLLDAGLSADLAVQVSNDVDFEMHIVGVAVTLTLSQITAPLLSHAVMNTVSEAIVLLLLQRGADPCLPGPEGIPLLHVAAATGDLRLARTLVRHGANVHAVLPGTEITPTLMALSNDKMELVEYFTTLQPSAASKTTLPLTPLAPKFVTVPPFSSQPLSTTASSTPNPLIKVDDSNNSSVSFSQSGPSSLTIAPIVSFLPVTSPTPPLSSTNSPSQISTSPHFSSSLSKLSLSGPIDVSSLSTIHSQSVTHAHSHNHSHSHPQNRSPALTPSSTGLVLSSPPLSRTAPAAFAQSLEPGSA